MFASFRHNKPQITPTKKIRKETTVFIFCFFPANLEMGLTSVQIIYHDQRGRLRVTRECTGKRGQPTREGTDGHTDSIQLHPSSWPLHRHYVAPGWLQLVSATRLGIRSTLNGENQKEWQSRRHVRSY